MSTARTTARLHIVAARMSTTRMTARLHIVAARTMTLTRHSRSTWLAGTRMHGTGLSAHHAIVEEIAGGTMTLIVINIVLICPTIVAIDARLVEVEHATLVMYVDAEVELAIVQHGGRQEVNDALAHAELIRRKHEFKLTHANLSSTLIPTRGVTNLSKIVVVDLIHVLGLSV